MDDKYRCKSCGHTFNDAKVVTGSPFNDRIAICPKCDSSRFDEIKRAWVIMYGLYRGIEQPHNGKAFHSKMDAERFVEKMGFIKKQSANGFEYYQEIDGKQKIEITETGASSTWEAVWGKPRRCGNG